MAGYQEKRYNAIVAAAAVFARKGYHGASTADIAGELGIRQGSLYYYFSSKEEALEEVCSLAMEDYVLGMERAMAEQATFPEKLRAVIRCHLDNYQGGSPALKVHNEQRFHLPATRRETIKSEGRRYREMLQQLFVKEVERGTIDSGTDCQFVARSVIGLCNAWGARIGRQKNFDLDALSDNCVGLILRGVGYRP